MKKNLITVDATNEYLELARLHEERNRLEEMRTRLQGIEDMENYLQKIDNDLFINYLDQKILERKINKKIKAA